MKQVVFLTMIVLVGCSCPTRLSRLMERCPPPTTSDTIYNTVLVYRDTTIYRTIPGDTIRDSIVIPVEVELPEISLKQRSTLAEATAWIRSQQLGLELIQYDSIFEFKLDSAIWESRDTITIVTIKSIPKYIKPKPFWKHGFLVLAGLVLITLVLFFTIRRK
jgi:hypothetical protein